MNTEQQLKLQAYLDGELSDREAGQVADWLAQNPAAQSLLAELTMTKTALVSNEVEFKLPESREFFWSKIERDIRQQEKSSAPSAQPVSIRAWLHRFLIPVSAAAVLALLCAVVLTKPSAFETAQLGETVSLNEEMGAINFRSESEQMTVIYLYDKTSDTE